MSNLAKNIPEINLYTYIASKRNPAKADKAIRYVISKGYPRPGNRNELAYQLHDYVTSSSNPSQALHDMVNSIHPDKELFTIEIKEAKREEEKQNACGCSQPLNATGAQPTAQPIMSEKIVNTLIISGVALLGISILVTVGVSIAKSR